MNAAQYAQLLANHRARQAAPLVDAALAARLRRRLRRQQRQLRRAREALEQLLGPDGTVGVRVVGIGRGSLRLAVSDPGLRSELLLRRRVLEQRLAALLPGVRHIDLLAGEGSG